MSVSIHLYGAVPISVGLYLPRELKWAQYGRISPFGQDARSQFNGPPHLLVAFALLSTSQHACCSVHSDKVVIHVLHKQVYLDALSPVPCTVTGTVCHTAFSNRYPDDE